MCVKNRDAKRGKYQDLGDKYSHTHMHTLFGGLLALMEGPFGHVYMLGGSSFIAQHAPAHPAFPVYFAPILGGHYRERRHNQEVTQQCGLMSTC